MRFWDASALVPMCVAQPSMERALRLRDEDPEMAVWWGTPVECVSALSRLEREGFLGPEETGPWEVLQELRIRWHEVEPGPDVRSTAERLLRVHALRAADALQIAAALQWAEAPESSEVVSFDRALAAAARKEGLTVLGEDA